MIDEDQIVSTEAASFFTKEQLLAAEYYQDRKDIVNVLLSSEEQYTVESVNEMIEKYMKGKVK